MGLENRLELSRLRLQRADDCLEVALATIETGNYLSSANRLYYAVFHSMRAILALDGIDMKHHSGVISEFRKRYIKTGLLEKELSQTITDLFDARTGSDYEDYYTISREEILALVPRAEAFLDAVKAYLNAL